ncbi:uncharacterized protein LOC119163903 isoform X2 [Rhipicephalus microplus]|uniref:uncharacterized protein LOC119163903 isoform X2 n=1 Tax=Rhipicephalus microplus TaxID=6941 RepID=UPI003F6C93B1
MISTRNFSHNTRDLATAIDEMMKFFARTLQCLNIFRKIRLKVTAVGNLDLLPIEMREKIAQTEIGSDDESPAAKLRLCVAYNTKVGLKNMVLDLVKAVQAGAIESDCGPPSHPGTGFGQFCNFNLNGRTSRPLRTVMATCGHLPNTGMAARVLFVRSLS